MRDIPGANRQDFSHRYSDEKSLLDEVLRRGRGERNGLNWRSRGNGRRGEDCVVALRKGFLAKCAAF